MTILDPHEKIIWGVTVETDTSRCGVYKVNIDAEQHKVTVTGSVDSATLIKKLGRSGKHAEVWSSSTNQSQNQDQAYSCIKDERVQNQMQFLTNGLKASTSHPILAPTCVGVEDENQTMGMENMTDEIGQNIMAKAQIGNVHVGGNIYTIAGDGNVENGMKSMMGFEGFENRGAGFVDFGSNEFGNQDLYAGWPHFEYHHPSYMMATNTAGISL
ncbi:hypothetical protein F0562_005430 [Nyssa sinensis]|uniref:HMA domain-containing protein n=1 Tax=Nyssa sinensis TaxID=561372 RepID=A0A5J5ALV4_9ASTE|nr:hypothetical protein F0562_005430 [Nyssa sinensis]